MNVKMAHIDMHAYIIYMYTYVPANGHSLFWALSLLCR